jgi:hypothetical protein
MTPVLLIAPDGQYSDSGQESAVVATRGLYPCLPGATRSADALITARRGLSGRRSTLPDCSSPSSPIRRLA